MRYDPGDEEAVEEALIQADLEALKQKEEVRVLLSSPGNRYWIWKLLTECRVFHTLSVNNPHDMAIRSGHRDIGLWVLEEIFSNYPDAFIMMQQEAKEREHERE